MCITTYFEGCTAIIYVYAKSFLKAQYQVFCVNIVVRNVHEANQSYDDISVE